MGVVLMVVVGAVLGWLTAVVLRVETSRGILMNIGAGVGGALAAGLFEALFGSVSLGWGDNRTNSLLLPLVGSASLLVGLNLLHRAQLR